MCVPSLGGLLIIHSHDNHGEFSAVRIIIITLSVFACIRQ